MSSDRPITILFLAADPSDGSRLRLGQELRDIRERLQLAKHRDRFVLESRESVRPGDISQALFDVEPQIVHFSGHGAESGELCFENELGKSYPIQTAALTALFELVADQINCVVLNACYSETQAKAIAAHIPFVIGMNQAIGDKAAIAFSAGFYKALGANQPVEKAYKFGCVEMRLCSTTECLIPVLHTKEAYSELANPNQVQWMLVLSGTIDEVKKPQAEAIVAHLRQLLGDASLTLQKIEAGSIKLFLTSSQDSFEIAEFLFKTRQLTEIQNHSIQEIQAVPLTEDSDDVVEVDSSVNQILEMAIGQELIPYFEQNVGPTAARMLELHLQGQSPEAIAESLNLSTKEFYRLREKINYHISRALALKNAELLATLSGNLLGEAVRTVKSGQQQQLGDRLTAVISSKGELSQLIESSNETRTSSLITSENDQEITKAAALLEAQTYGLTLRESEIWLLRRANLTYRNIASELHITVDTVRKHMTSIYAKRNNLLQQENRVEGI